MFKFFGVEIPADSRKKIEIFIKKALDGDKSTFIATLNPEILLHAGKDEDYRNILNSADIRVIDGFGVKLAAWLKGGMAGERFAGPELPEFIIQEAIRRNLKIGIVIKENGFSTKEEIESSIKRKWEKAGIYDLRFTIYDFKIQNTGLDEITKTMRDVDILIVGLGAPEQDKLIWALKGRLLNLKLAMGVGGTFDYWTGKQKRAPRLLQRIGLEWLWRLACDPKRRIKRIWNATFVFLWKVNFKNN